MASRPMIAVVGQTASGKTALAIEIAKKYDGEIICADSRTVYKGMNISTAKPTDRERGEIPHHLLDVVNPNEPFSAAQFKALADDAIRDISSRNKLPILVGGSGLFVDGVLYDFSFEDAPNPVLRSELQDKTIYELQTLIRERELPMPENTKNPRHLIRAIERGGKTGDKKLLSPDTLIIGLQIPKDNLEKSIAGRLDAMLRDGLVSEIEQLTSRYGWDLQAFQTPEFKAIKKYVQNEIDVTETKELVIRGDLQLAKRQLTWFKRNPDITWAPNSKAALQLASRFMSKYLLQ